MKLFLILCDSFETDGSYLCQFDKRDKDRYDLGIVQRNLKPGDHVRVRIKSRQRTPETFASLWSNLYEVIEVKGVFVSVIELGTGRVYLVH